MANRYLVGPLPAEEPARFEEHLIACEERPDRLERAEGFRHAVKNMAAEDAAQSRAHLRAGFIGWLARLKPLAASGPW